MSGYNNNWRQFERFCSTENLSALPATEETCTLYIASLAQRGTVEPESVQPYLSVINRVHIDCGHPPPARGALLDAVRLGWAQRRADDPARLKDQRRPLPAAVALAALSSTTPLLVAFRTPGGGLSASDTTLFRALLYTGFGFQLMARADTDASLAADDLVPIAQPGGNVWRLRLRAEKGKRGLSERRTLDLPRTRIVAQLDAALAAWAVIRAAAWARAHRVPPRSTVPGSFWLLPEDPVSLSSSARCSAWLTQTLAHLRVSAPGGFQYSSHSLRSGAASAGRAINVRIEVIGFWGGWASPDTIFKYYIDPSVPADSACVAFFGWLLPAL